MITCINNPQQRFALTVSTLSEQGGRTNNEDDMGMIEMGERGFCCVLADGAGGQGNGGLAASITIQTVLEGFRENPMVRPAALASLISLAEQTVSAEQPSSVSRKYMSSTVVLLTIDHTAGQALWAHWGDSRLYWFRGQKIQSVTLDHSMVQQLLQAGIYRGEDPRDLPNRNMLAGAIGADSQVPPSILNTPMEMQAGDAFLLCSDGLWENVRDHELEATLQNSDNPSRWLDALKQLIFALKKPNQDNFSAIALFVSDNSETP